MDTVNKHEEEFSVEYLRRLFGFTSERWYALEMQEAQKKSQRRIDYIAIYYKPLIDARVKFNFSKKFFELLYYVCTDKVTAIDPKFQKKVIAELKSFVKFYTDHTVNIYLKPSLIQNFSLPLYSKMVKMLGYSAKQSEVLSRLSTIKRISSNYLKLASPQNINIQASYTQNYIEESKFFEEFLTIISKTSGTSKFIASMLRYDFKIPKKFKNNKE